MPNYKVYTDNKTFVKVGSTYAGKKVWGIAKLNPETDTFDYDYGYRLAKARCDVKVAKKRYARALKKFAYVRQLMKEAEAIFDDSSSYLVSSWKGLEISQDVLNNVYNAN